LTSLFQLSRKTGKQHSLQHDSCSEQLASMMPQFHRGCCSFHLHPAALHQGEIKWELKLKYGELNQNYAKNPWGNELEKSK